MSSCEHEGAEKWRCHCGSYVRCLVCGAHTGHWFAQPSGYYFIGRADEATPPRRVREKAPPGHTWECLEQFYHRHPDDEMPDFF